MAEMESQVSEFTRSGGELISVGEALMAMKARKEETQKSIKEAGETELELQVRLGALQEAVNRESARVEQAGRNRAEIEEEFRVFAEKMQEEAEDEGAACGFGEGGGAIEGTEGGVCGSGGADEAVGAG
jgi:hypothetical protein